MDKWVEEKPNDWTYELKCPECGYHYSPEASEDGTISRNAILLFCPKCGNKLEDPAKDKRW